MVRRTRKELGYGEEGSDSTVHLEYSVSRQGLLKGLGVRVSCEVGCWSGGEACGLEEVGDLSQGYC